MHCVQDMIVTRGDDSCEGRWRADPYNSSSSQARKADVTNRRCAPQAVARDMSRVRPRWSRALHSILLLHLLFQGAERRATVASRSSEGRRCRIRWAAPTCRRLRAPAFASGDCGATWNRESEVSEIALPAISGHHRTTTTRRWVRRAAFASFCLLAAH